MLDHLVLERVDIGRGMSHLGSQRKNAFHEFNNKAIMQPNSYVVCDEQLHMH